MRYSIIVLPNDSNNGENSRREVNDQARLLAVELLKREIPSTYDLPGRVTDTKTKLLIKYILEGRFWDTLRIVDGTVHRGVDSGLSPRTPRDVWLRENEETRKWAREKFGDQVLEKIVNVAVNQAILRPHGIVANGTNHSHSLLYDHLQGLEGSMFAHAVTPELRARLNNGRFWEELSHASIGINSGRGLRILREVLTQNENYGDLDPDFANEGYRLAALETTDGEVKTSTLDILDLNHLGEKGLAQYARFIAEIDKTKCLDSQSMQALLRPYFNAVLGWDGHLECPYYFGGRDFDHIRRGRYEPKLKRPIIQKYLKEKTTREHIAEILAKTIEYHRTSDRTIHEFVGGVLALVPEPKGMVGLMLQQPSSVADFFTSSAGKSIDLSDYLPGH